VTVNNYLTRSSAVAKRPRDTPCRWKFCCHSRSFWFTPLSTVRQFLLAFRCGYVCIL